MLLRNVVMAKALIPSFKKIPFLGIDVESFFNAQFFSFPSQKSLGEFPKAASPNPVHQARAAPE